MQREHDQRQEHAVPGELIQERGPAPRTGGRRQRQPEHDAEEDRHDRQHAEQREVPRAAEHEPELGTEKPQPGGNGAAAGRRALVAADAGLGWSAEPHRQARRAAARPRPSRAGRVSLGSAADAGDACLRHCWTQSTSKPSPVSSTNSSSRLRRGVSSPATGTPACTSRSQITSGSIVAEVGPDLLAGLRHAGQPEVAQDASRPGPASASGPAAWPARAARRSGPWIDQLAGPHHAHVRADLLDLGQQVRRHEHGGAVRGDLPDQRRAPRGCPAGRGRSSARPGSTSSRCRSRLVAMPSRCFMPSEYARYRLSAAASRPTRSSARSIRSCARRPVRGPVRRVQPGQVGPAGQVRVERRAFHQRADQRQRVGLAVAASAGRARRGCPRRLDQAEQHADRRRLAGAVRAEEAVDRAGRHRQVDPVHGELAAAELLRQPAAGQR